MANLAPAQRPLSPKTIPHTPAVNQPDIQSASFGLLRGNSPPRTSKPGELSVPPPTISQPGVDTVTGWVPPWTKHMDMDQGASSDEEDLQV